MPFSRPIAKFFSGSSNLVLARRMSEYMNIRLGEMELSRFSDGEVNIRIAETVRGHDVFVMQSTCDPVNENLMELLVMIDAFKRASANSISVIIPYFGYARQDRKAKGRDPITAKLVSNIITEAGADRVITLDLHAEQIQGFFDIPLDNLQSFPVFIKYFQQMELFNEDDFIVVSPDVGAVKRARRLAEKMKMALAILDKRRPRDNVAEIVNVVGDVKGKNAILFDDIIDTGGSLVGAAEALKAKGAKDVIACATHGILSGDAVNRLENSLIKRVLITNTIPHNELPEMFTVLDLSRLLGEAVLRVRKNLSVSILFK
ncbi:MAG: ribose-phosphate diphosphokinase [Thermotogota bacterium]